MMAKKDISMLIVLLAVILLGKNDNRKILWGERSGDRLPLTREVLELISADSVELERNL